MYLHTALAVYRLCKEVCDYRVAQTDLPPTRKNQPFVIRTKNHTLNSRIYYRTRTHRTRLESNKKLTTHKPPTTKISTRFLNSHKLGMSQRGTPILATIESPADYFTAGTLHNYRTHRYFPLLCGNFRKLQRFFM